MAVVIHEFEVVAERPPMPEPSSASASAPAASPPPAPRDIERVIHHQRERLARVRAH